MRLRTEGQCLSFQRLRHRRSWWLCLLRRHRQEDCWDSRSKDILSMCIIIHIILKIMKFWWYRVFQAFLLFGCTSKYNKKSWNFHDVGGFQAFLLVGGIWCTIKNTNYLTVWVHIRRHGARKTRGILIEDWNNQKNSTSSRLIIHTRALSVHDQRITLIVLTIGL